MQIIVSRQIGLPTEELWRHLVDYGGVARFHPFVDMADKLSDSNESVGARRKCNFYDDNSVVEKVIEWEPGRRMKIELSEMNMPMKWAVAEIVLSPMGEQKCEASFIMNFQPKFGLIGALMGAMMMKPMMRKMFSKVLQGLDHHARTGEVISKDGNPAAKEAMATA
jgi:hypothetical protein